MIITSTGATVLALLSAMSLSGSAIANPEPRPPGPPPALDFNQLASLSLTPQQALDAEARANNAVVSNLLGPHVNPPRPDEALSQFGKIQIVSTDASGTQWLGDGSLDGSGVFTNTTDMPSTSIFPSTTCSALPPLFSIYSILAEYAPLPYMGLATFTALPNAASSLGPLSGGYAFITPTNQTNPKTFAQSDTALGTPYKGESAVWSLDCITHELTASWTLSDGSSLPLSFVSWSQDGLVATGNYDMFKSAFPTAQAPLKFVFVPSGTGATTFFDPQTNTTVAAVVDQAKLPVVSKVAKNNATIKSVAPITKLPRPSKITQVKDTPTLPTASPPVNNAGGKLGQSVQSIVKSMNKSVVPPPAVASVVPAALKHKRHRH